MGSLFYQRLDFCRAATRPPKSFSPPTIEARESLPRRNELSFHEQSIFHYGWTKQRRSVPWFVTAAMVVADTRLQAARPSLSRPRRRTRENSTTKTRPSSRRREQACISQASERRNWLTPGNRGEGKEGARSQGRQGTSQYRCTGHQEVWQEMITE